MAVSEQPRRRRRGRCPTSPSSSTSTRSSCSGAPRTQITQLSEAELDELQERHLAYRADLERRGLVAVRGPFDQQSDPSYRGMSVFTCDARDAARLSEGDPSVAAGRLTYDVMQWWVRAGALAFPLVDGAVGERRAMPSE